MNKKTPVWLTVVRILLACLFLFSSFTKAVDPVNFGITMGDYFTSFGMSFLNPLAQLAAIVAITCEFVLGCMLLFRVKVNLSAWGYLLFMIFFFFLTLWLAVAEYLEVHGIHNFGVVKDCGCFGQAVKMSNLQTFLKNVVIIIPTIILFINRKRIPDSRLSEIGNWLAILFFAAIAVLFQIRCIRHLPFIDFSDWKKGEYVVDSFIEKPAEKEVVFVYKNNNSGEIVELSQDELMNQEESFYSENEYVDRKDSVLSPFVPAKIPGFNMLDENGADHAYEYLNPDNTSSVYMLFIHDLSKVNGKGLNKAKQLASLCNGQNVFVAVTNSSEDEIADFVAQNKIEFTILQNPIDPVKGPFMVRDAVRSNPGLILFRKGVVVDKWAWRDFPAKPIE